MNWNKQTKTKLQEQRVPQHITFLFVDLCLHPSPTTIINVKNLVKQ